MEGTRSVSADGRQVLRLERRLDHPIEKVWQAIVEPGQLSQWYPFEVLEMDLRVGGTISFDDGEGTVYKGVIQQLNPGTVFSFTEADDLLHLELRPDGDGCLLILTHTFDDPSIAESNEIGWNQCVDILEEMLEAS